MTTDIRRSKVEIRAAITGIRGRYVSTKRDRDFETALDRLIAIDEETGTVQPVRFTATDETRGIIVVDGAGGGKTSLVQRGLTAHPGLKATDTTRPVVSITVPNPATLKSVAQEALKATGYIGGDKKRTAWEMWQLLRERFQMLGTVVFWIDEAHDLFPHGSKSEAPHILKTFKSLMQGDGAVIVILSGVGSLWESISFDHQVNRRYSKFELPPVVAATDSKLIWKLLTSFCDYAELDTPERGDLVERIIHAGRKRFGLCVEQMISAIEIALLRGDTKLDVTHFADAFFAQEACVINDNVFLAPRWSSIDLISKPPLPRLNPAPSITENTSMSILFPFLPFDQEETPISFVNRLAGLHLRSSALPFLRDIDVKVPAMLGCKDHALKRLADVSGADVADLHRNSAHSLGDRRFDLRGNLLSSEFFANSFTGFCPACLREDDERDVNPALARRGRLIWTLRAVRTCPVHNLELIRRKKVTWCDAFHMLAVRVPERGEALNELVEAAAPQSPSPLQNYVIARLNGDTGSTWLDSQSLEQAVRASQMLGVLLEFGAEAETGAFEEAQWEAAGRSGFAVTSGGEGAIRDALQAVRTDFAKKGGKPELGNVLGQLYRSLASRKNSKDPGDIKRIVREHIFENVDLPAGTRILGEVLTERRFHSVASLASETGIHPDTLRNVLAAKGLVPVEDKVSGHHVFDATAGREVSRAVQRSTKPNSLPKALNCTRPQAIQLVDEGLLDPIADGRREAAGRTRKAIYDRDIAQFLERLHARARVVEEVPVGMVSIAKAAEQAKMTCIEVLHLVLGGFAQNVTRLAGIEGYAAIYVDPIELRARKAMHLPGMSASDAFGKLKIPKSSGWDLAKRQAEPRLQPIVVEGTEGRYRYFRFDDKCVASFASQYTTEPRVANANEIEVKVVHARLKKKGIKPVLGKIDIGIDLYRVSDIPNLETS